MKHGFASTGRNMGFLGQWEDSGAEPFDVTRLAIHRASLSGNIQGEPAEELARVIVESLFEEEKGACVLPSFRIGETTSNATWLVWSAPSLKKSVRRER